MSSERIPIGLPRIFDRLKRELARLEARLDLFERWVSSARHKDRCQAFVLGLCTCGLWELTGGGLEEAEIAAAAERCSEAFDLNSILDDEIGDLPTLELDLES